jgi:hypothetical protein
MNKSVWTLSAIFLVALISVACGGGGSNTAATEIAPPVNAPPVQQSRSIPANLRVDEVPGRVSQLSGFDYLPLPLGSEYTYLETPAVSTVLPRLYASRVFSSRSDPAVRVVVDYPNGGSEPSIAQRYRRTTAGWRYATEDADTPPNYLDALNSIVYIPDRFYESGLVRRSTRQGDIGEDLDGDGLADGFQIIFEQVFRGTQTLSVHGSTVSVAVLETTVTRTVIPTSLEFSTVTAVTHEKEFFQLGVGVVRRSSKFDLDPEATYILDDAQINGLLWRDQLFSDGEVVRPSVNGIAQITYSPTHNRYYAIEQQAIVFPTSNVLAVINPIDASVTRKQFPGILSRFSISSDESVMYVGYRDSPTILKLQLPSLTQLATYTFSLPPASLAERPYVESLAVNPSDSNKIAAKFSTGASPGAVGVYAIADGQVQAVFNETTSANTYPAAELVANSLFFGADDVLYTIGSEILATEILNRLQISGSTITKSHTRNSSNDSGFHYFDSSGMPSVSSGQFIIGKSLYSASDLSLLKTLPGNHCSFLSADRIGCQVTNNDFAISMQTIDRTANQIISTIRLSGSLGIGSEYAKLLPGPQGQIALFTNSTVRLINLPSPPP